MMKNAKEYSTFIMEFEDDKDAFISAMGKVVMQIVSEIKTLMIDRNIKKKSALKSIILQQDQKWKAVCSRINQDEMRNIFMLYLRQELPDLLSEANME